MFKLLLTVFLGICVGAVVADLLFGPDQPATPGSGSQGQQWEPWRSWYLSARRQSRRVLVAIMGWSVAAARAVDRRARRLASWATGTVQLVPDGLRSLRARRQAVAERNAAHARHVAHLETVTARHAPPRHAPVRPAAPWTADATRMSGMSTRPGAPGVPGALGMPGTSPATEGTRRGLADRADPNDPMERREMAEQAAPGNPAERTGPDRAGPARPLVGPPMGPPPPAGPPVPVGLRGQELVATFEMPVDAGLATPGGAAGRGGPGTLEPLGRPPWDALVRRPPPRQAPAPRTGRRRRPGARGRKRSRRDPLGWMPGEAERPADPEWDEGVPVPLTVPLRVRLRSATVLLAVTTIFGVITAVAVLVALVMAVGALDRL